MVGFVRFELKVPVRLHQDGAWTIASCDILDLHGQGAEQNAAIAALVEAMQAFVETCFEMGTLDEVLRQCGFRPGDPPDGAEMPWLSVPVSLVARGEPNHPC